MARDLDHSLMGAAPDLGRRFNDAIRSAYGRSPRDLRAVRTRERPGGEHCDLRLGRGCQPPFDWAGLRNFLALRAIPEGWRPRRAYAAMLLWKVPAASAEPVATRMRA